MAKRILLLLSVNFLIMISLSIIMNVLGLGHLASMGGGNLVGLFILCLFWGMGGAFISLMISRWMAKTMMGVQLVTLNGPHKELVEKVHRLARRAGIMDMPEVGIYQSEQLNAFATGPSKNKSLVAVSSGLLSAMNDDEIEGVLAHEIAHIANGDMVTMTLIQGVMNAFVMFLSRLIAHLIDQQMRENDRDSRGLGLFAYMAVVFILDMIFGLLASIVVAYFSRYREFKADLGGAQLASKDKMLKALQALNRFYPQLATAPDDPERSKQEAGFKAMQISSKRSGLMLFSTHPALEDRIDALKRLD